MTFYPVVRPVLHHRDCRRHPVMLVNVPGTLHISFTINIPLADA